MLHSIKSIVQGTSWPRPPGVFRQRVGRRLAVVIVGLAMLSFESPTRAAARDRERDIKAAYLYNFLKYAEWPNASFAEADSPIVIGILGKNPFGEELAAMVRSRLIRKRAVRVKLCATIDEARECHLLYVSPSENKRATVIVAQLEGRATLTVGESEAFARAGGMIRFIRENTNVRFEINQGRAESANLRLNAQLLRLARKIRMD